MKNISLILAAYCLMMTACAQSPKGANNLKKAYPQYKWGENRLMK